MSCWHAPRASPLRNGVKVWESLGHTLKPVPSPCEPPAAPQTVASDPSSQVPPPATYGICLDDRADQTSLRMQTSQRFPTSLGKTPNSFVGPHPLPRSHLGLLLCPTHPAPAQVCANLRAFVPALSTDSSRHTLFHLSHHPGLCLNLIYSQGPSMTTLSKMASLLLFKTTVCFFSFILQIVCI